MINLRGEWKSLLDTVKGMDRQTIFVLVTVPIFVLIHHEIGSRSFFRRELAEFISPENTDLASWAWWFGTQGVIGFIIPVLCLVFLFKRRGSEIGLGLGDWKLALKLSALYLPLVIIGTFLLSADPSFQAKYPHLHSASTSWKLFLAYELLFIFYWFGWEYLWRGYLLFGTARTFGVYAIFIQAIPFAILHAGKPFAEAILSVVGGIALGALVWRCRSFWIAIPIHAAQMLILDFFCSLRIRTGVDGFGLSALFEMLSGI